ncbi:MAG: hypothetical protein QOF51_1955 [Chloroflexota bacterium]|jgi:hypothetical protein|nr:hypothetical protein [Chloroflexota bacterium]
MQRYCVGFWRSWTVAEFVRKRTEWVAERANRDGCDRDDTRRRLPESRGRVNAFIHYRAPILRSEDAITVDLAWLHDPDDLPVMQTALAARADVLVTDNSSDFPLGESRNGIYILGSVAFLQDLYRRIPPAEASIQSLVKVEQPVE